MKPFFSIIMPVYNVEKVFPASFESVIAQDDRDFEVILVDDGATDSSGRLCDEYAAQYPSFVRVVHKPNGGLSSARNAGMEQAQGQYILMPDSDDRIEPDTLSSVRAALSAAAARSELPVDMVRFDQFRHVEEEVTIIKSGVPEGLYTEGRVGELLDIVLMESKRRYPVSAWSHAYRRAFLEENQLRFVSEREIFSEDYLFVISALMVAKSVYILDKPLYHYIDRAGSLTNKNLKIDAFPKYTKLYGYLLDFASRHGADDVMVRKINTYYVNKLAYGYCMVREYRCREDWETARRNVKNMLRSETLKKASGRIYAPALTKKHILRILCIHMGWEAPLAFTQREWKNNTPSMKGTSFN